MGVRADESDGAGELDLEALLRGDRQAFERLVRQESPRLYRVIYRVVQDEDEAQSIMQEAYLQAYQRLSTFRRESKFTTWLYAIALNLARGVVRKRRRHEVLDDESLDRLQPQFVNGHYVSQYETWSPLKVTEQRERHDLVHEAVGRLPDDYRSVVILRDLEQRSTAEAAEVLGISEGAVRVRLHRARQALRSMLDDYLR